MLYTAATSLAIAIALHSIPILAAQCTLPAILNPQENIWKTRTLHPTSLYRAKVEAAVKAIKDEDLKGRASKVADIGTFTWLKSPGDIQAISALADEVPCDQILGLVLDNLPYKSAPSNGPAPEYDEGTEDAYKTLFIEPLATTIKSHPNTAFALIIEPNAFPQYFNATTTTTSTTPSAQHEKNLARSYRANIPVALRALELPNAIVYLDAGHSNSLDWALLRNSTAEALGQIYEAAGRPARVRGFAANVAGWNAWDLAPGEFARADDSRDIRPSNEKNFIRILSSALQAHNIPTHHALLDTSRNGVSGLRYTWDEWCNVNGAGLGVRPRAAETTNREVEGEGEGEGEGVYLDAFVWVKRPGESDGVSSERGGDPVDCAALSAVRPAPERDVWFQGFFEMLVRNADPEL
ncbi:glycoside hydrolase family 6 protein [Xylaria arbuscula]|nr:glycoside hydrolase family 6 protein [Xylaria arbuscula]